MDTKVRKDLSKLLGQAIVHWLSSDPPPTPSMSSFGLGISDRAVGVDGKDPDNQREGNSIRLVGDDRETNTAGAPAEAATCSSSGESKVDTNRYHKRGGSAGFQPPAVVATALRNSVDPTTLDLDGLRKELDIVDKPSGKHSARGASESSSSLYSDTSSSRSAKIRTEEEAGVCSHEGDPDRRPAPHDESTPETSSPPLIDSDLSYDDSGKEDYGIERGAKKQPREILVSKESTAGGNASGDAGKFPPVRRAPAPTLIATSMSASQSSLMGALHEENNRDDDADSTATSAWSRADHRVDILQYWLEASLLREFQKSCSFHVGTSRRAFAGDDANAAGAEDEQEAIGLAPSMPFRADNCEGLFLT
jgi:hypothetical protein